MKDTDSAESIVLIDEHKLDKECLRLPSDYLKWAHRTADLRRDIDEAKGELEVVEAELGKKIRAKPAVYGLEKITESAIKEVISLQDEYQDARAKIRELDHDYQLAQAVVGALEQKKRSLTLLVDLHGMSYFSEPALSANGREKVEKMTQSAVRRRARNDD